MSPMVSVAQGRGFSKELGMLENKTLVFAVSGDSYVDGAGLTKLLAEAIHVEDNYDLAYEAVQNTVTHTKDTIDCEVVEAPLPGNIRLILIVCSRTHFIVGNELQRQLKALHKRKAEEQTVAMPIATLHHDYGHFEHDADMGLPDTDDHVGESVD